LIGKEKGTVEEIRNRGTLFLCAFRRQLKEKGHGEAENPCMGFGGLKAPMGLIHPAQNTSFK
jgi:hypothetical protein